MLAILITMLLCSHVTAFVIQEQTCKIIQQACLLTMQRPETVLVKDGTFGIKVAVQLLTKASLLGLLAKEKIGELVLS